MGRIGKIARLPRSIRTTLNNRIEDGEPGTKLVQWLNSLDEVKEVQTRSLVWMSRTRRRT